ncbi:MAG: NDP-sugar synthase, partial [Muribaculaceae bacterium]|nr:NDP-sugar synthase [Muribaculaceae bacterium]
QELGSLLRGRGRFVLTTVDTIFREDDFRRYVDAFASAPADVDGMMAVTRHIDDEKPLYVETAPDMRITAFRDEPWPEATYISGGIYGLDSRAIDVLDDCLRRGVSRMRNFQRALVGAGLDLKAFDMGDIIDVDHAGDIEKARAFLTEGAV